MEKLRKNKNRDEPHCWGEVSCFICFLFFGGGGVEAEWGTKTNANCERRAGGGAPDAWVKDSGGGGVSHQRVFERVALGRGAPLAPLLQQLMQRVEGFAVVVVV